MAIYDAPESLHVGNGVETVFGFNWPYLLPRDLVVTVNGMQVPTVLATQYQVSVTPAPAALAVVRIFRNTPAQNPLYLFATGIPMLPKYIDGNNKQLLYALQEGLTEFRKAQETADQALAAAAAAQAAAAQAAASAAQQAADMQRTIRVPPSDPVIPTLSPVTGRAGKVMGFDNQGRPVAILPASGSGTEVALDLASGVAGKGADMSAWTRRVLDARMDRVSDRLNATYLHVYEYVNLAIKPTTDPLTWDWAPAIQACLNKAFSGSGIAMYSANAKQYHVVVDFGGLAYPTSGRVQVPDGGGVVLMNGLIYAQRNGFTSTHLMRFGQETVAGAFRHENVKLDKMIFDGRHVASGVLVSNSLRCSALDCTFLRYKADGFRTVGTCVEIHVMTSHFGIRPFNNTNPEMGDLPEIVAGQVGIRLGSTDNRIMGCIFHRGQAIVCSAQAQHISGCQFYGADPWGWAIEIRTSDVTITDCAFGKFGIKVFAPFNVTIVGNMFVMENTAVGDWGICLAPLAAGEFMSGVAIFGNTFRRSGGTAVGKSIHYDTTQGTIARVRGSLIRDNAHFYVRETCVTKARIKATLAAQSTYNFDFSSKIEFGLVDDVQVNLLLNSGSTAFPRYIVDGNLAQLSRAAIPVRLDGAYNGSLICHLSVEEDPLIA